MKSTTPRIGRMHLKSHFLFNSVYCAYSYGFIHDRRLPESDGQSIREKKQLEKEMSRVDKWKKMLQECSQWFPPEARYHQKMVGRVWKVTHIFLFSL